MANGRSHKRRVKGKLEEILDNVATVKEDKPVSKDVVKAAANLKGIQANYNQAYRCIQSNNVRAREDDKVSFQLIIPYLSKFMMKSNR
jgi:hypothetical protein